jgi:hypothetical protein
MKYAGIAIGIVLLATGTYWWYSESSQSEFTIVASPVTGDTGPRTPPPGFTEYRNDAFKFAFFYPSSYEIKEFQEGPAAITLTVQSTKEARGFQVFVVPYGGRVVSPDRFERDIPSGDIRHVEDIELSGAPGIVFVSSDIALGETREVWAVNGGFLYEITSLTVLDEWLAGILEHWRFI